MVKLDYTSLTSKKQIQSLFDSGISRNLYPIKLLIKDSYNTKMKVLFVVPKRQFSKAVTRNKIRRRMKEAFRVNLKLSFDSLQHTNSKILALIFIGKDYRYHSISEAIKKSIEFIKQSV